MLKRLRSSRLSLSGVKSVFRVHLYLLCAFFSCIIKLRSKISVNIKSEIKAVLMFVWDEKRKCSTALNVTNISGQFCGVPTGNESWGVDPGTLTEACYLKPFVFIRGLVESNIRRDDSGVLGGEYFYQIKHCPTTEDLRTGMIMFGFIAAHFFLMYQSEYEHVGMITRKAFKDNSVVSFTKIKVWLYLL